MNTKLTLRIDSRLINKAKSYAKCHGKSVSQVVGEYLNVLNHKPKSTPIMPITRSLRGIAKHSKISEKDYKKYLEDKYL